MSIDTTFFDKMTKIDDMLSELIKLQTQTYNAQVIDNRLQTQIYNAQVINNRLLTDLLNKPMTISAPQLTTISNEQTLNMPENVDVSPQLYYDLNRNKYYRQIGMFSMTIPTNLGVGEKNIGEEADFINTLESLNQKCDMAHVSEISSVGYNLIVPATLLLDGVVYQILKDKHVFLQGYFKDSIDKNPTDRNDDSFYFIKGDKLQIIYISGSARAVRVFLTVKIRKFNEITESTFKDYLMRARKFI